MKGAVMTEGFRSPPPSPAGPGFAGPAAARQDAVDTVRRVMGEDIAPTERPAMPPTTAMQSGPSSNGGDTSTAEVAKQQAADVADTAKQASAQVTDTVKEQARQAADKARQAAGWLADRDPGSLLDEVRSFARHKPGTYLAIALGAGVLAGRLTRGLTAPTDNHTPDTSGNHGAPGTSTSQVGTGRRDLTDVELPGAAPGYRTDPITDPLIPVTPPAAGPGTIGAPGGARGY